MNSDPMRTNLRRTTKLDLQGQVAVVTGAAKGIGKGIALTLAQEGASVVVNYLQDEEEANAVVRALSPAKGCAVQADVSQPAQAERLIRDTVNTWGTVDIVVNNAGICPFMPFLDISPPLWEKTWATNVTGPFFVSQAAARYMVAQHRGSIINIASVGVYVANAEQTHYAATKGAVVSLTRSLAVALGPDGIRVNALLVGGIPTAINVEQYTPDYVGWLTRRLPLRKMGTPDDVGKAVAFLASPRSQWITGAALAVDGGRLVAP